MNILYSYGEYFMKKNLLVLFLLLILLIGGGLFWIAHSFNAENYKEQLIKDLSAMTGRNVEINEGVSFSWTPFPTLVISDLSISNQKESSNPTMFFAKRVYVEIGWLSLFKNPLVVKKIILDQPVLLLERIRSYETNFNFPVLFNDVQNYEENSFLGGKREFSMSVEEIEIKEGQFSYNNVLSNENVILNGINGKGKIASLNGPFSFLGSFLLNNIPRTVDLRISQIESLQPLSIGITFSDEASGTTIAGDGTILKHSNDEREWLTLSGSITSKNVSSFMKSLGVPNWPGEKMVGSFSYKVKTDESLLDSLTIRQGDNQEAFSILWEQRKNKESKKVVPTLEIKNLYYDDYKEILKKIFEDKLLTTLDTDFYLQADKTKIGEQILDEIVIDGHIKDKIITFSNMNAGLPYDTSVSAKGSFDIQNRLLDADVQLKSTDPSSLIEWAINKKKDSYFYEDKIKNIQCLGHFKGWVEKFLFQVSTGMLDDVQFSGNLEIDSKAHNNKISLNIQDIDIDSYVKDKKEFIKNLFPIQGFYSLDIEGKNLKITPYTLKEISASVEIKNNNIILKNFSGTDSNESKFSGDAVFNILEDSHIFADKLKVNFTFSNLANFTNFFNFKLNKDVLEKLNNREIKGVLNYSGTSEKGKLSSNINFEKAQLNLNGDVILPVSDIQLSNSEISFSYPDIQKLLKLFNINKNLFPQLKGDVKLNSTINRSFDNFTQKFSFNIGKQVFNGSLDYDSKEKNTKLNLNTPYLNLDSFLPSLQDIDIFDDTPFNYEINPKWQVDLQLKADNAFYSGFNYHSLQLEMQLKDQVLSIPSFTLLSENKGKITSEGSITFKMPLIIQGKGKIENIPLKTNLNLKEISLSDGNLTMDTSFVMSGNSWYSFIKNMRSEGKFIWKNGNITGVDFKELNAVVDKALKQSQTIDVINDQLKKALSSGETKNVLLSANFNMDESIFSFSELNGETQQTKIFSKDGRYSLFDKDLNTILNISLSKFKVLPALELQIKNSFLKVRNDSFSKAIGQEINVLKQQKKEDEKKQEETEAKEKQSEIIAQSFKILEYSEPKIKSMKEISFDEVSPEMREILDNVEKTFTDVKGYVEHSDLTGEQLISLQEENKLLEIQSKELDELLEKENILKQKKAVQNLPLLVKPRITEISQIYEQNRQYSVLASILKGAQQEEKKIIDSLKELEKTKDLAETKNIIENVKLSFTKIQKALNYARQHNSLSGVPPTVSGDILEGGL